MTLINMLEQYHPNKINGQFYPARVVNNNDPLQQQRVQCRISQMLMNCPDNYLPWARQIGSSVQGNAQGMTSVNVPVVGSSVWVFVPDDDVTNIYYTGTDTVQGTVPSDFLAAYPNCYGHVDSAGNLFIVNTATNSWKLNMANGSVLEFNGTGCTLTVAGNLAISATGSVNLSSAGAMVIASATSLEIGAPVVSLGGSIAGAVNNISQSPPSPTVGTPATRTPPTISGFNNQLDY